MTVADSEGQFLITEETYTQVLITEATVGPQGPPGEVTAIPEFFSYTQSPASATWTINHPLNKYPSVTVVDSADSVIIPTVEYDGPDTVILRFNGATAGKAYLN